MRGKFEIKAFLGFCLIAGAASCGQVADLGNNGTGTGGIADTGTGGVVNTGTGGVTDTGTGGTTSTGGVSSAPPDDPCVAVVLGKNACTASNSNASATLIGAGLVLEGSNLGARLSTTVATYRGVTNSASCVAGALIIDPESPADSVLFKKVSGTQDCGDAMPGGMALKGGPHVHAELDPQVLSGSGANSARCAGTTAVLGRPAGVCRRA